MLDDCLFQPLWNTVKGRQAALSHLPIMAITKSIQVVRPLWEWEAIQCVLYNKHDFEQKRAVKQTLLYSSGQSN